MSDEISAFLDKAKITEAVARLARGEDRRNADLIRSCWWEDAKFDYGVYNGDFDAYLAWVVPGADAIIDTQHLLGQTLVELDGDKARAETHVFSYHRVTMEDGDHDTIIGGRYLDQFERRPNANGGAEWKIADRVMLYDWEQDWGASADWSKGVMGYPFTADHFPGRAKGDHSEGFFNK